MLVVRSPASMMVIDGLRFTRNACYMLIYLTNIIDKGGQLRKLVHRRENDAFWQRSRNVCILSLAHRLAILFLKPSSVPGVQPKNNPAGWWDCLQSNL